jgi:hypothetical protein
VAVGEHGESRARLKALREQERAAALHGIVDQLAVEAQGAPRGRKLLLQIGAQLRRLRGILAFRADRDAARERRAERAVVEGALRGGDGGSAADVR